MVLDGVDEGVGFVGWGVWDADWWVGEGRVFGRMGSAWVVLERENLVIVHRRVDLLPGKEGTTQRIPN